MSFEEQVDKDSDCKKLDISLLRYFWQTNPLLKSSDDSIPQYLKQHEVFKEFTDLELHKLAGNMHQRAFDKGEVIFKENDPGVGFYFILKGAVDIVISKDHSNSDDREVNAKVVVTLDKKDYFGELALLQNRHLRNATAIAKEATVLLGIFKPDVDIMINEQPVIASKLLQSISVIVANRLYSITQQVRKLKEKIRILEEEK